MSTYPPVVLAVRSGSPPPGAFGRGTCGCSSAPQSSSRRRIAQFVFVESRHRGEGHPPRCPPPRFSHAGGAARGPHQAKALSSPAADTCCHRPLSRLQPRHVLPHPCAPKDQGRRPVTPCSEWHSATFCHVCACPCLHRRPGICRYRVFHSTSPSTPPRVTFAASPPGIDLPVSSDRLVLPAVPPPRRAPVTRGFAPAAMHPTLPWPGSSIPIEHGVISGIDFFPLSLPPAL